MDIDNRPPILKQAGKRARCDTCGVESQLDRLFLQEGYSQTGRMLCPRCWTERQTRKLKRVLWGSASFLAAGLLLLCALIPSTHFRVSELREFPQGILLVLFFFPLFGIPLTLLHESGHALAARAVGWRVYQVAIGWYGRAVFERRILGCEWSIRSVPVGGFTVAAPVSAESLRLKGVLVTLGGPLVNFLLMLSACFLLVWADARPRASEGWAVFLHLLMYSNLIMVIVNLSPRFVSSPFGKVPTDGMKLQQAFSKEGIKQADLLASRFFYEGMACQKRKQYDDAQAWFDEGLRNYPVSPHLQNIAAFNLIQLSRLHEARERLLKSLARPDLDRAAAGILQNNLAWVDVVLAEPGLLSEADRHSLAAFQNLGWMPEIKGTRGAVLVELGRVDEGVVLLNEAFEQNESPSNKAANACWLASAEQKRGNLARSRDYWETAEKLDPECLHLKRKPGNSDRQC